jgi:peptide/nickel transport system substrate-binding protein
LFGPTIRTLLLIILLPAILSGCLERRTPEELEQSIIYGYESDVYTFDPTRQRMMKESAVMAQVLEGLVRWNNEIETEPCLALRWESTEDCRLWTFWLRENVLFHDGTPFTADAVVAHFQRTLDEKNAATRRHLILHIESIEAPEPHKVVFRLNSPDCTFAQLSASTFAVIPSPAAVADLSKPFGQNPIGTGPYKFVEWIPDVAIRLEKFQQHWRADQYHVERLEFRPLRENTTRFILLEQGSIDMADIYFAQVNVARESTRINLQTTPQLAVRYIGFNNQKPPFSDIRVRQAANYAVNREEMIKYQFFGVGMPAQGPLPPALPNYNADIQTYSYDPEKARRLLVEAGYPNGVDVNFWTTEQGEYRVAAEAVSEYLRKVGIRVNMRIIDNAAYWRKFDEYVNPKGERHPTREGVFDMYVGGWVGGESEFDYLKPLFLSTSSSNTSFYSNKQLDAMLASFQATPDPLERRRMMLEMQSIISADAPWIFAYYSQVSVGYNPRIEGFKINPSGRYFFHGVHALAGGGLH